MHSVLEIFHNQVLIAALIGWFVAQALKIPIHYLVEKEWDIHRFHGSGGMPSSHSSMVVSAAVMVGGISGFGSVNFALAAVFATIVMYDAAGVRRETGRQATVINQIIRDAFLEGKPISDKELKELVGHKPIEVAAGAVLGIIVSCIYIMFIKK